MNEFQALIAALEEQRNSALNGLAQVVARNKILERQLAEMTKKQSTDEPETAGSLPKDHPEAA